MKFDTSASPSWSVQSRVVRIALGGGQLSPMESGPVRFEAGRGLGWCEAPAEATPRRPTPVSRGPTKPLRVPARQRLVQPVTRRFHAVQ